MTAPTQRPRRLLVFTGNGKGKTTAALGMVLRACGHKQRALVVQFIKCDADVGEVAAIGHLPGVTLVQTGLGFLPPARSPAFAKHREAAERGLDIARRALADETCDLLVLDEVCTALAKGLLELRAVVEAIGRAQPDMAIVLTGRGAPQALVDMADTVTEMQCVKHALEQGIPAADGVER